MRLEVVNGQVGFIGKANEEKKIEKALEKLGEHMNLEGGMEHDVCEFTNTCEITEVDDMDFYTVEDVKAIWRAAK